MNTPSLIVDHPQRGRLLVTAHWDIDGTVNNESLPESQRMATVHDARQAVGALAAMGIFSGPISARSHGECQAYHAALEAGGCIIAEDGAVLETIGMPASASPGICVLSRSTRSDIVRCIERTSMGLGRPLESSLTASPDRIAEVIGHGDVRAATLSADRRASAFLLNVRDDERPVIDRYARSHNLRTFGTPLHLLPMDVSKGKALLHLDGLIERTQDDLRGIFPIVFGNSTNDASALKQAVALGGIAALVAQRSGGYAVAAEDVPTETIMTSAPDGAGMLEALVLIRERLSALATSRFST